MLFKQAPFEGFGPNQFDPTRIRQSMVQIAGRRSATLRQGVRESAPRCPGVYGMLDPRGRLIYVGKAKCLRARLLSYFRPASRDPKAGRILGQTRSIIWEPGPNEFAALLRELELIRQFRPGFNVRGQPGRRQFVYLALGRGPVNYAHLVREAPKKGVATYGPLPRARRLGDCVRKLNDMFQLRDCPQSQSFQFADQAELFPDPGPAGCLRYEIGTCHGPCIAAVSRRAYSKSVRDAKAFLDGFDDGPIREVETQMSVAAASLAFERAASLRDRLADLTWLRERLLWLNNARREFSFVYPVAEPNRPGIWYLIRGGRVFRTVRAPTDQRSRKTAANAIEMVYPLHGGPPLVPGEQHDHVLLVSAWFRRHAIERTATLTIEQARHLCHSTALRA